MSCAADGGAQDAAAAAAAAAERRAILLVGNSRTQRALRHRLRVPRAPDGGARHTRRHRSSARDGEPVWKACLRVHWALHGPWHKLAGHSKGLFPYLREYGVLAPPSASARGLARFAPTAGSLPARVTYGAVAEMVQLAARGGPISAELYKEVAAFLESHNRNERTASQPLHMAVREIYKTCYPGHGSGAGAATGVAPGVIPGGSSTGGALTGRLASLCLGSGLSDEEMRKRLDTTHEFFALVSH